MEAWLNHPSDLPKNTRDKNDGDDLASQRESCEFFLFVDPTQLEVVLIQVGSNRELDDVTAVTDLRGRFSPVLLP